MKILEYNTIGEAWQEAFNFIMQNGHKINDENEELIEYFQLILKINSPNEYDPIAQSQDKEMIEWMRDNFTHSKRVPELNNAWSYGWRLFNYQGKNQIDWVVEKLKSKPESKSATISMLQKAGEESYVPCVSLLDFKIRNNQLILTVTCRSLDFGKKAIHNLTNLARLCKEVMDKLGLIENSLVIYVISAHVYKKDWQ